MTNQDPIVIPGDEQERKIEQVLAEIRTRLERIRPREVTLYDALDEIPQRSFLRRIRDAFRVAKKEFSRPFPTLSDALKNSTE